MFAEQRQKRCFLIDNSPFVTYIEYSSSEEKGEHLDHCNQ